MLSQRLFYGPLVFSHEPIARNYCCSPGPNGTTLRMLFFSRKLVAEFYVRIVCDHKRQTPVVLEGSKAVPFLRGSDFELQTLARSLFWAANFTNRNSRPMCGNTGFIACAEIRANADRTNCCCFGLAPRKEALGALHSA